MNKSRKLYEIGQALWLDQINREFIINGWLEKQISERKIWGMTTNPSIFYKAISESSQYLPVIQSMSLLDYEVETIYDEIAVRDVQDAADLLTPIYEETGGRDGYISIEVNPSLAHEKEKTIIEAKRIWNRVNRKNIFIKIPATKAGIFSVKECIYSGINVNITLIFSIERYKEVVDAYFSGLNRRIKEEKPIFGIHSVASFFISRMDVKVDKRLKDLLENKTISKREFAELRGRAGISNGLKAYQYFLESKSIEEYQEIIDHGANIQRPLWASTSTKSPDYSDVLYIESLILRDTVNTAPLITIEEFSDHGSPEEIDLNSQISKADHTLEELGELGIDLEKIEVDLEKEGVGSFIEAQNQVLESITEYKRSVNKQINRLKEKFLETHSDLSNEGFYKKVCEGQPGLWSEDKTEIQEIRQRLDWMGAPTESSSLISKANLLLDELVEDGFTHAVVLGMGGSSLAPEVYSKIIKAFDITKRKLEISILDSTNPDQILELKKQLPLRTTVFLVSSKSGTTTETLSLLSYFWELILMSGNKEPGNHFIAITDPGTKLEKLGTEKKFRKVISANPNVGGRYSALIEFGLIPAVFSGMDAEQILQSAAEFKLNISDISKTDWNPGISLGVLLGTAYKEGKDKLTIFTDEGLESIGSWIEQLVAESSGKEGKGILPVAQEPLVDASVYKKDRFFVFITKNDSKVYEGLIQSLADQGHPVVNQVLEHDYDIGRIFYIWELAIASACSLIGVNAFNQPDVQLSKEITKEKIREINEKNTLEYGKPFFEDDLWQIYFEENMGVRISNPQKILSQFIDRSGQEDFFAINAFLNRNPHTEDVLQRLRKEIMMRSGLATTLGFGPRFLHSTGQYHKGGKNIGNYIVFTKEHKNDFSIPKEGIKFGSIQNAQALGDIEALKKNNRRVIHFHLKSDDIGIILNLV